MNEKIKKYLEHIGHIWDIVVGLLILVIIIFSFIGKENQKEKLEIINTENNIIKEVNLGENTFNSYKVVKVVDGDTISVNIDGVNTSVRMIGIDTPETVDPRKPVQCFGQEASNKAKATLSNQMVYLELDPSQAKYDKYYRLLAYVFLADGTNFNELMIKDGYAYEYTYSTPYKYQSAFKSAQKDAQTNKRGLWADGVCEESEPTPTPAKQQTQPTPIQSYSRTFL